MKFRINNDDGIAFVMVILLLALVGSLATAMLIMNSSNINLSKNATARSKAFYAAEGGVNYLDLKLNEFYKDKIAEKGFFSAKSIDEELQDLNMQLGEKISDYNISIKYNPNNIKYDPSDPNYKDTSSYYYEIIADNNNGDTETIIVEYLIEHLIDYFRYTYFANEIQVDSKPYSNTTFRGVADHALGTSEVLYNHRKSFSNYKEGELVVYDNKAYRRLDNDFEGSVVNPSDDDLGNYWQRDNSFKIWNDKNNYQLRQKVIYNNDIYTRVKATNNNNPENNNDWELNDPDLAEKNLNDGEVEYNITGLPSPEDYDYEQKIVEAFKKKLDEKNGYIYEDDQRSYNNWRNKSYKEGTKINYNGKVYRAEKRDTGWFGKKYNQPEPEKGYNWRNYWSEMNAGQNFIDNYSSYDHNDSGKGNYIYIKGDLTPNQSNYIRFSKPNEVLHILVDGEISPNANLNFSGDANIIIYTTSDTVSFENASIYGGSTNLAYFAPFATFRSENFTGDQVSSMVFNKIKIEDDYYTSITTYDEDNPLRGSIEPEIADLTRIHGGDYSYNSDKTGPVRLNWSVE